MTSRDDETPTAVIPFDGGREFIRRIEKLESNYQILQAELKRTVRRQGELEKQVRDFELLVRAELEDSDD